MYRGFRPGAGSNVFSNVPFVLVAGKWIPGFTNPELWKIMDKLVSLAANKGHTSVKFEGNFPSRLWGRGVNA
jgi:hypothetical protein